MDRLQKIFENINEMEKNTPGIYFHDGGCINLMEEPGFAEMSFMKRKARLVETTLDHHGTRFFPGELLGGTILGTRQEVIYNTYEERLKYADMNLAFPRRNNRYVDGKEIYSSKALRLTEEELKHPGCAGWSWGHSCGGFPRILAMGYQAISDQAKENIRAMEETGKVDIEKKEFWEAVSTSVEAVCRLSEKHAVELDKMAEEETDEENINELVYDIVEPLEDEGYRFDEDIDFAMCELNESLKQTCLFQEQKIKEFERRELEREEESNKGFFKRLFKL